MSQAIHGRVQGEREAETEADVEVEEGCVECGGRLEPDGIEAYCVECGLVEARDHLDRRPVRSRHSALGTKQVPGKRFTVPVTYQRHDHGIGTLGIHGTRDATGKPISPRTRRWINRLRANHKMNAFSGKKERGTAYALGEIKRIGSHLELDRDLVETACQLYHHATSHDLTHGRSLEAVATACVCITLRIHGLPFKYDAVVTSGRVSASRIQSAYDAMNRELELPLPPPTPREYVTGLASTLDVPSYAESAARDLAESVQARVTGRNPRGIAAACLYIETPGLTQIRAGEAAGVSEVTIRSARDRVLEALGEEGEEAE